MKPELCKHATIIEKGGVKGVQCAIVIGLVGRPCGHPADGCLECAHEKGDQTFCRETAKQHLHGLIIGADRVKFANRKDLMALAESFAGISTTDERLALLADAATALSKLPELTKQDVFDQLRLIDDGLGTAALEAVL